MIRQMLDKLKAPHSYEITIPKRYSESPEIRIKVAQKDTVTYARMYSNDSLSEEEVTTPTNCYRISHTDSTILWIEPSIPSDANLFMLDLEPLNLGYTDVTGRTDLKTNLRKIKIYLKEQENSAESDDESIIYVIDVTTGLPVALLLPGEQKIKFINFRFDELDDTDVNFDPQRYNGYKFEDLRNGSEWIEEADEPDEDEEVATAADLELGVDEPIEIVEVVESEQDNDPQAVAAMEAMYDRLSQPHRYTGTLYYLSSNDEAGLSQEITHSGLGSPDLSQNRFHILTRFDGVVGREHFFDGQTYTLIDHRERLILTSPYPPEQLAKDPMLVRDSSMICFGISPVTLNDKTMYQSINCFTQGDIHEPLIFKLSSEELLPVMIELPSDAYAVRYSRVKLGIRTDADTFKLSKKSIRKYIKKGYRIEEADQE